MSRLFSKGCHLYIGIWYASEFRGRLFLKHWDSRRGGGGGGVVRSSYRKMFQSPIYNKVFTMLRVQQFIFILQFNSFHATGLFLTLWKHQQTSAFLILSGGLEKKNCGMKLVKIQFIEKALKIEQIK